MNDNSLPPLPGMKKEHKSGDMETHRMEITIHVCDDTKNLKKDFTCPRDLLLREMKYFQDYLSSDIQKWEDVDISVHCDIKIFDWLIQYVKRDENPDDATRELDKLNAVSILISSEFLKMDQLVEECIEYCHANLSAIIATPCNMNCINDKLVSRIAYTFDQHELELVKDKKDKFKSKLFSKKIEELFDPSYSTLYSPNNASFLFRCVSCGKLLLPSVEDKIECTPSRTWIDSYGKLKYIHLRDTTWDVTEFLLSLKAQEKNWRNVYWRLWSVVNYMKCSVCGIVFPLCDFKYCRYHPQPSVLKTDQSGIEKRYYPCCDEGIIRFEPIKVLSGCEYREHKIDFSENDKYFSNGNSFNSSILYNELLNVVETVCISNRALTIGPSSFYRLDLVEIKELRDVTSRSSIYKEEKVERKRSPSQKRNVSGKLAFTPKQKHQNIDSGEEDETDNEFGIVRVVIHQKESPLLGKNNSRTWNSELSLRLNQDMQRESDVKRMKQLMEGLRLDKNPNDSGEKGEISNSGIFAHLENKFKNSSNSLYYIAASNPSYMSSRKTKISDR